MKEEEKIDIGLAKQLVSYSEEEKMPLLPTTASVQMAIDILKDPTKIKEAKFEADEHFVKWWNKEHDTQDGPNQSELNLYVAKLVEECRLESDEIVRKDAISKGRTVNQI
jgi:hypothetical protein